MGVSVTVKLDQRYLLSPFYAASYDLTLGNAPTLDLAKDSLKIAGTAVTTTAAELNLLDTATVTTAELNYLDIAALGTGAASKAVVLDTGDDYTWPATGILTYGASALNASGTELNAMQMDTKMTLFEDFHGTWTASETLNADMWVTTAGSGQATQAAETVAASLVGEVTMQSSDLTGATSANASNISSIGLAYKADQGGLVLEARVKIDDITEAYIFVGFTDAVGSTVNHPIDFTDGTNTLISDATDACGIVFSGDATTQEWCHGGVKSGSDTTAAFSGSAPSAGVYDVLRVEVSATGAVRGFINGTAVGVEVASAITAGTAVCPIVVVSNTVTASQVTMTLDYIWVQMDR